MIINKEIGNITLTYCNLCGTIMGGYGRLHLKTTFDTEEDGTDISINICPECSSLLVRSIDERILNVDERIADIKSRAGSAFISLLHNNVAIEPIEEFKLEALEESMQEVEEEEEYEIEDIPEDLSNPVILEELLEDPDKEDSDITFVAKAIKADEDDFYPSVQLIESIEGVCERYTGTIDDEKEFANELIHLDKSILKQLRKYPADDLMKGVREILRINTNYRLKIYNKKWYLHIPSYKNVDKAGSSSKHRFWTTEEDEFLSANFYSKGIDWCCEQLKRSKSSCASRMTKIRKSKGIELHKKWSKEDIELLMDNYKELGISDCAKQLGRTVASCEGLIYRMTHK